MPDTAQAKIIGAYAALLSGYAPLTGKTIITDRSPEDAIDREETPAIVIYPQAWSFDASPEQGQTIHEMLLNFDVIESSADVGIIGRAAQEAIANIIGAIHSDRVLGNRLEDAQEIDVAPPTDNGKSVGGASLQIKVQFITPRGDHFTILGLGGATF